MRRWIEAGVVLAALFLLFGAAITSFVLAFILAALVQPLPRRFPRRGARPTVTAAAGRGIRVEWP